MGDDPNALTVPGLPALSWERRVGWRCSLLLPGWVELAPAKDELAAGEIPVTFACERIYDRPPPTAAQVEAFQRLVGDAPILRSAILQATFDEFQEYLNSISWIVKELGRPLTEPAQLTRLISLIAISVRIEQEGEPAELSFDFDCLWDPEHGFAAEATGSQVTFVGAY